MKMPTHPTRRRFLRQATAAAAGTLFVPTLIGCGSSQKGTTEEASAKTAPTGAAGRKLGVAILGLGGYADGQIAPALRLTQHCELRGLITGSPEKLPEWRRKYGVAEEHCYTYDTMAEIANDDAIDVVYVITPTSTHKDFSVRAARAGKHVWCEKPMAMTTQECQDIIDACDAAGVQLTIGYRMLHEPNTQQFIQVAKAKTYGAIRSARSDAGYAGNPAGPPADYWRGQRSMGGGALYDMGVYTVNGLRYGTQLIPEAVIAATQRRQDRPDGADLTTEYTLRFPGGFEARGRTSVVEKYNVLHVEAERGWYEMEPMQPYQGVEGKTSDGKVFGPPVPNQQSIQMDNDALAIINGTAPLAPGREGLIDVAIIRAIIESAEGGREVKVVV